MPPIEEKIINDLKTRYDAKAIVLHGSRVAGTPFPDADWDLFVFTDQEASAQPETFEGQHIDVSLIQLPIDPQFILTTSYGPVEAMKVLYDPLGMTQSIIERTLQARQAGPLPLPPQEYRNRKNRLERLVSRMKRYEQQKEVQYYYVAILYQIVIRYWFELQTQWQLPTVRALKKIESEDPAFYDLLQKLVHQKHLVETSEKIYQHLFEDDRFMKQKHK